MPLAINDGLRIISGRDLVNGLEMAVAQAIELVLACAPPPSVSRLYDFVPERISSVHAGSESGDIPSGTTRERKNKANGSFRPIADIPSRSVVLLPLLSVTAKHRV
jgi:hypothetical protein